MRSSFMEYRPYRNRRMETGIQLEPVSILSFNNMQFPINLNGPFKPWMFDNFCSSQSVSLDRTYIRNGKLGVHVHNGGSAGFQLNPMLSGDFDAQCSFDVGDFQTVSISDIGFVIISPTTSNYVFAIYHYNSGWKMTLGAIIDGSWSGSTEYNYATSSSKLKITRSGNVFTAYYWNGSSWSSLGSKTLNNFGNYGIIQVWGNNWRNTAYCELLFYDFILNNGSLVKNTWFKQPDPRM